MSKKHIRQNKKQKLGQFFTENASELLSGFESLVDDKAVIDPFAGHLDLINWGLRNGAYDWSAYDIEPLDEKSIIQNDSILNPPDYSGKFLLSNPPYLSRNKNKDKAAYFMWDCDDLYKCHLASLYPTCDEGILILPTNFISESRPGARKRFFQHYGIGRMKYFYYQVFPNATTGVLVFNFFKDTSLDKRFSMEIHYKDRVVERDVELKYNYDYLYGDEFFDYIHDLVPVRVEKFDTASTSPPNTNIVIGLLSYGKYALGAHYNEGSPIVCGEKSFTTYQVSVTMDLTEDQQRKVVERYNEVLQKYIKQYDGLFLANYMGAEQKIKSRNYSNLLLSKVIKEILHG